MLTKEDMQLLSNMFDEKLKPVNERLDKIEEELEIIKYSTNELVKWVDTNFRHQYPFPIDRDIG